MPFTVDHLAIWTTALFESTVAGQGVDFTSRPAAEPRARPPRLYRRAAGSGQPKWIASVKRPSILQQLEDAERHVVLAMEDWTRQRKVVAQLEAEGLNTEQAVDYLRQLEQVHAMHLANCRRLVEQLVKM